MRTIAFVGACAMALCVSAATPTALHVTDASESSPMVAATAGSSLPILRGFAERRYRIIGKVRLALFWVGRDDVGGARMTWRSDGSTSALTLLAGSNPERAPRSLNEWGYIREEVRTENAEVFSLRSLDTGEAAPSNAFALGDGPMFGVSCSAIDEHGVTSARTTVSASGVTYRMFNRLLDHVVRSPEWNERRTPRPAGAVAGFLTALQQGIRLAERDGHAASRPGLPAVTYVYNNAVFDLTRRGLQPLGRTTVGVRTFDRLVRADFSIRNKTTGEITTFGVTYSPDGEGGSLPVQIFYQPSFWLRIELRLDDEADVPADPATDEPTLARIRDICAGGAH